MWLIIDPWKYQPNPAPKHADIVNDYYAHKIDQYLTEWSIKYKLVLLDDEEEIAEPFKDYPRMSGQTFLDTHAWGDHEQLVYTGFHHGQCIVYRPWGVKALGKQFQCYVIKDLCCMLPGNNWVQEDKITQQYAKLI